MGEGDPLPTASGDGRPSPAPDAAPPAASPPPPAAARPIHPDSLRRRRRSRTARARRWVGRRAWPLFKSAGVRVYGVALLFVIGLLGYWAFAYMLRTLFNPADPPKQLVEWRGTLRADALRAEHVPGVTGPTARAPLAHYHGIEQWYQPDPTNSCAVAGCHRPLPHVRADKAPAFANFHTTFLRCQICHSDGDWDRRGRPADATWFETTRGAAKDAPAALQLANLLESRAGAVRTAPASIHRAILDLLTRVTAVSDPDALLKELRVQIDTSEPGSPVWRHAVAQLTAELPQHTRGEYHAKIGRKGANENTFEQVRRAAAQADRYEATSADSAARKDLHQEVHAGLHKQALTCLACHGDSPPLLDLHALGYPASRAAYLRSLEVARLMQQVRQGERFYLPRLLEGSNAK